MAVYGPSGQEELYHYGVLGMKWGVRKDRDWAYRKADKKAKRNYKKYQNLSKAAVAFNSASKSAPEHTMAGLSRKDNERWADFNAKRAVKQAAKGAKWLSEMDKTFSKVGLKLRNERGREATDYFNILRLGAQQYPKLSKKLESAAWKALAVSMQYDEEEKRKRNA